MSSHDFDYKLKDPQGHNVASLRIDHSEEAGGPQSKLVVHLYKNHHTEASRNESLQEYKGFADVLSLKSEIVGATDVHVTTNGNVPDSLMQYVGMDLLKHHKIGREEFDHFNDAIRNYETAHNQKLVVAFAPVEALHHGQALLRSGAQHTSHDDHHHEPARENTGMGSAQQKKPQLWEI